MRRDVMTRRRERAAKQRAGENHIEVGEVFGMHWLNGHGWGVAHPEANCYADAACTEIGEDGSMRLNVALRPRTYNDKAYTWGVGLVRSREAVKYGRLEVTFRLPMGRNLLPAIWLYDEDLWPPEIDVFEGWSGRQRWWTGKGLRGLYRKSLLRDYMHPSLIAEGRDGELKTARGGWPRAATWRGVVETQGIITACMNWMPERVEVYYNDFCVLSMTRDEHPEIFAWLNASDGMNIILNNYTTNAFGYEDYVGIQRAMEVLDLEYRKL